MTSPFKISVENDQRALDFVKKFMAKSRKYCEPYFKKFDKIYAEYFNSKNDRRNPLTISQLKPPTAFNIVESFKSELLEAFFGGKPYVGIASRLVEAMQFEKSLEDFGTYQLDQADAYIKCDGLFTDVLLFGTGIVKVNWKVKQKKVRVTDPITGERVMVSKWVEDRPDFQNISVFDFFPDPTVTMPGDIEGMRGCVHRVWRTLSELKTNARRKVGKNQYTGIYRNIDMLELAIEKDFEENGSGRKTDDYSDRERVLGLESGIKQSGLIEVLEYHGKYSPNNDGEYVECIITVANNNVVLRIDENPYNGQHKPFVAAVNFPVRGEFYGMGEIEPIWSYIQEYKALRNARLDAVNLAVNPMYKVDRNAGFNLENLYSRGGGVILGDDINGIQPMPTPDTSGSTFREVSEMEYAIQQAVGMPNPASVSPFSRTAEGVKFIQGQTSSRVIKKIRILSKLFFERLLKQFFMLNSQFLDGNIYFRVTGDQQNPFSSIPPEAFDEDYLFSESFAMERLTKRDRQGSLMQNIIPTLQMSENYRPGLVKWDSLVPRILKDFDYRDTDAIISTPEEMAQFQQGQQQVQMQMAEHNAQAQAAAQMTLIQAKTASEEQKNSDNNETKIATSLLNLKDNGGQ